jgi:hypothetical protein
MKLKLHLKERFYTDMEAGVTVCVLTDPHYSFFTTRGIAKCSPEDAFDIEYGARLARQRAEVKMQKKVFKYFADIYNGYAEQANKALDDLQKEHEKLVASMLHLADLEKESHNQ